MMNKNFLLDLGGTSTDSAVATAGACAIVIPNIDLQSDYGLQTVPQKRRKDGEIYP